MLTSTDTVAKFASLPVVVNTVNAVNQLPIARKMMDNALYPPDAPLPQYAAKTLRKRTKGRKPLEAEVKQAGPTRGKVALFATCYGNNFEPVIGEDLIAVFEHNGIPVTVAERERCWYAKTRTR